MPHLSTRWRFLHNISYNNKEKEGEVCRNDFDDDDDDDDDSNNNNNNNNNNNK